MPNQTQIVMPGPRPRTVYTSDGNVLEAPPDWEFLEPGDAGLTRRVKAGGPTWTVEEKVGRKRFTRGVWAPKSRIESIRADLAAERATEAYQKKRASATLRREKAQEVYVEDFQAAIVQFLNFDQKYAALAERLATAVAAHATPVGSGTVARTTRIPIEQRAESAVIAWLRHQTTAYDSMKIARVKGQRREVRRMLAAKSRLLLEGYRSGNVVSAATCPLATALGQATENQSR